MKRRNYIVPIAMGLAFALPPTLVLARASADRSGKGCGEAKPEGGGSTLTHEGTSCLRSFGARPRSKATAL